MPDEIRTCRRAPQCRRSVAPHPKWFRRNRLIRAPMVRILELPSQASIGWGTQLADAPETATEQTAPRHRATRGILVPPLLATRPASVARTARPCTLPEP